MATGTTGQRKLEKVVNFYQNDYNIGIYYRNFIIIVIEVKKWKKL
jgi:hypothetical protein